jgi:hypothetical protein
VSCMCLLSVVVFCVCVKIAKTMNDFRKARPELGSKKNVIFSVARCCCGRCCCVLCV